MTTEAAMPSRRSKVGETEELIIDCRRRDAAAWSRLNDRLRKRFKLLIRSRIPGGMRKRFDTDDVMQSAILSVYEHLDGFEYNGEGSLDRWMLAIIDRRIKSRARQHGALQRDVALEQSLDSSQSLMARQEGLDGLEENELILLTMTRIAELDEKDAQLVQVYFFDQKSIRSIARERATPESTVRRQLAKALLKLKHAMAVEHA